MNQPPAEQLELVRSRVRRARTKAPPPAAPELPVARVAVDVSLAHLDRLFDYEVPADLHEQVVPGSRVGVWFAGKQVSGFVLERVATSDHDGTLQRLRRAVSAEPVLTSEVAALCRAVADHWAGTLADVLRLAVPPRHARVEREPPVPPSTAALPPDPPSGGLTDTDGGAALLRRLAAGEAPRACWTALPGDDPAEALAAAAAATLRSGRGSVLVAPDGRDVSRIGAALATALGPGRHVALTADLGPAARYRAFLAVLRGQVQVVVGTRAAAFAPVREPGLVAVWDDGDDLHAEPRAPYPHARDVLVQRAHLAGAAALLAGHARTPEVHQLAESGWLVPLAAPRPHVRARWPQVQVTGSDAPDRDPAGGAARLPHEAFVTVRDGLTRGPVLVQVARSGYRAGLVCQQCRARAVCVACHGPLSQAGADRPPGCGWCGRVQAAWTCNECGSTRMRAPVVGEARTAEELGRGFPRVPVRRSSGERVLDEVPDDPAVVVATPGAEPHTPGGYAAAVVLDTALLLARTDLRTAEESLRRWLAVAALVRPAAAGGRLLVVGDPGSVPVQALVRADPEGFAARELADRVAARLPPAVRLATVEAPEGAVDGLTAAAAWPDPTDVLGPVPLGPDRVRLVLRVPRAQGAALSRALAALQGTRSARKLPPVRVQVDPVALG